jgi:hypothetical protein
MALPTSIEGKFGYLHPYSGDPLRRRWPRAKAKVSPSRKPR